MIKPINEATLTSKERNALSDKHFGLPKERKYPLTDKEHVTKAIQFFKFAPANKKSELANNINKRAKELGMSVKLGKDSLFRKYADKTILAESLYTTEEIRANAMEVDETCNEICDKIDIALDEIQARFELSLSKMVSELFSNASIESINSTERALMRLLEDPVFYRKEKTSHGLRYFNIFKMINEVFKDGYNLVFDFMQYDVGADIRGTRMIYEIFNDIFTCIDEHIYSCDVVATEKKLRIIENLVDNYPCNRFLIYRKLKELLKVAQMELDQRSGDNSVSTVRDYTADISNLEKIKLSLSGTINDMMSNLDDTSVMFVNLDDVGVVIDTLKSTNMNMINIENYLNTIRKELKNEIDIIKTQHAYKYSENPNIMQIFQIHDINENGVIYNCLNALEGLIDDDILKLYNKDLTYKLDAVDLMVFNSLKKYDKLCVGKDIDNETVYYAVCEDKLYLLAKKDDGAPMHPDIKAYYMILLNEPSMPDKGFAIAHNLSGRKESFDYSIKLKSIKFVYNRAKRSVQAERELDTLTEGFYIDNQGNMKFKFKPKKTYMDEYAENHKILIANSKAKNYEAMKPNLAFLFALINQIERDVIHAKEPNRLTHDFIENARKARTFAINDFKTYMKEVQKYDPKFDFTKYYEESDYGKFIVTIDKDELVGIKKLVRVLLLS